MLYINRFMENNPNYTFQDFFNLFSDMEEFEILLEDQVKYKITKFMKNYVWNNLDIDVKYSIIDELLEGLYYEADNSCIEKEKQEGIKIGNWTFKFYSCVECKHKDDCDYQLNRFVIFD